MTKKGAHLTTRDQKLIRTLYDYGILSSSQIGEWLFPNVEKTTVLRRLRRLQKGGFIRRRGNFFNGTGVFVVGKNGAKALGIELKSTTFPYHQIEHELEISEVRFRIESLMLSKSWMSERDLRSFLVSSHPQKQLSEHKRLLIPDALVLFHHFLTPNAKVKIEMELSLKSDLRYRERFKSFGPLYESPMHFYWYFVKTDVAGEKLLRLMKKYSLGKAHLWIGYTVLSEFKSKLVNARLITTDKTIPLTEVFGVQNYHAQEDAQEDAQGLSTVDSTSQHKASA